MNPPGHSKGLGPGPFEGPPWALLRAWARAQALKRAQGGPSKGPGPRPLECPGGFMKGGHILYIYIYVLSRYI